MRAAMIENGVVVNVIEIPDPADFPGLVPSETAGIGDLWDGEAFARPPAPELPLEQLAAAATERINQEAGEQRARHITVTTGQEGTYVAKQTEAERFAAGAVGPFPYLEAEALETGMTIVQVAALVNATAAAWTQLNAAIEGKRRGSLVAVERAVTAGDRTALDAVFPIAWPGQG